MSDFSSFFHAHMGLCIGFIIVVILYFIFENTLGKQGSTGLTSNDFIAKSKLKSAKLIDVRPDDLFKLGHISGSINHPLDTIKSFLDPNTKTPQNNPLQKTFKQKDAPLLFICKRGITAESAASLFRKSGYKNCFVLKGGLDQWTKDELPLIKPEIKKAEKAEKTEKSKK